MKNIVDALVEKGGNYWEKGSYKRVYFDLEAIGLHTERYGTGNISNAELNGEKISNAKAGKLGAYKAYYDVTTGECVVSSKYAVSGVSSLVAELQENLESLFEEAKEEVEASAEEEKGENAEEAEPTAEAEDLPELTGTEKQSEAAKDFRKKAIEVIEDAIKSDEKVSQMGGSYFNCMAAVGEAEDKETRAAKILEAFKIHAYAKLEKISDDYDEDFKQERAEKAKALRKMLEEMITTVTEAKKWFSVEHYIEKWL